MVKAHPVAGKQKAIDICNAFIAGAPKDAEGHVFFGVNHTNKREFDAIRKSGETWYYIDNSYFDVARGTQFRVTRNALQHTGSGESDFKRFAALGLNILPWREDGAGRHIVVCPQSDDFMKNVLDYPGSWLAKKVRSLEGLFPEHPVRVREWNPDKIKLSKTLEADLVDAWALCTHSSAAAITAVMHGVPVMVDESCPVFMTGTRWLKNNATRHHLFSVLADNQFTLDEMKKGFAWDSLHPTKIDKAGSAPPVVQGTGL